MSYFPSDIPYMSEKELMENSIEIPKIEPYLKPCPFCGGKATLRRATFVCFAAYNVICNNPNCKILVNTLNRETEQEAIEIWNRRVTE